LGPNNPTIRFFFSPFTLSLLLCFFAFLLFCFAFLFLLFCFSVRRDSVRRENKKTKEKKQKKKTKKTKEKEKENEEEGRERTRSRGPGKKKKTSKRLQGRSGGAKKWTRARRWRARWRTLAQCSSSACAVA
jgi:Flp pilus assembly protein TadB